MMGADWIAYQASEMKWQPPPEPWTNHDFLPIATMYAVGYVPDSDYLLVLSETGRGVFDCRTGERVGRDRNPNEHEWWDTKCLIAQGIPPVANQSIRTVGHYGGGLKKFAADLWHLERIAPYWPLESIVLSQSSRGRWSAEWFDESYKIFPNGDGDSILAYGFSDTDKSFVIACSSGILLYSRL
ncbi:MAG: hypothetical protein GYB65_00440 [Chloroflexi bacterium]|nr:hypothetical protein [Chloroflexota bacterium]